ncbi:MAG: hypothetical protein KAH05_09400 [Clostridiales bacterium]|nr:hypothetical protein [Clostridiales bacterium]
MTRKSKTKILVFVLIGILLIFSISIYLDIILKNDTMTTPMWVVAIVLIVLATVVVIMTVKRIAKTGYEKNLKGEYLELYEDACEYLEISNISKNSKREIKEEILDVVLNSQEIKRNPEEIFGNDFGKAMEGWVISYGGSNKKIALLIDGAMFYFIFLLALHMLNYIENMNIDFFDARIDNSILIYIGILAFIVMPIARINAQKRKYFYYIGVIVLFVSVYIGFSEITHRYFSHTPFSKWYSMGTTNVIASLPMLLLIISAIISLLVIKKLVRKKN